MKKVNTFIVGAPKCGTTSLSNYLKSHPNISVSEPKEPHFFSVDIQSSYFNTLEKYHNAFEFTTDIIVDASTWYLFSEVAAKNIFEYNPEAKIIILLRNPSDMIFSLYLQNIYNGCENVSFEKAIEIEKARKNAKQSPCERENYKKFLYTEAADYLPQIERYIKYFGERNIKILSFEEFKTNTEKVYYDILKFLSVKQIEPIDGFKVYNKYSKNRSQRLKRIIAEPSKSVKGIGKILPRKLKLYIGQKISELNKGESKKPKLEENMKQMLEAKFQRKNKDISERFFNGKTF